MGSDDGTNVTNLGPIYSTNTTYYTTNTSTSEFLSAAENVQAVWAAVRSLAGLVTLYKNATSVGTAFDTSTALPAANTFLLALNISGTASQFGTDKFGFFFMGSKFTQAQLTSLSALACTLMQ